MAEAKPDPDAATKATTPTVTTSDRSIGGGLGGIAKAYTRPMTRNEALMLGAILLVVLDGVFFLLGRAYYIDKLEGAMIANDIPDAEAAAAAAAWDSVVRTFFWAYFTFSTVGTLALTAAVLWPRQVAHGLATVFGAAFVLAAAVIVVKAQMPILVAVFLGTIGGLMLRLAWSSYRKKDRAAWAFLLSLAAVLAVTTLFGGPRIRAAIDAPGLWYVLTIPFVMTALALALYRARHDYA